jgi:small conductance mechanosensitive channel
MKSNYILGYKFVDIVHYLSQIGLSITIALAILIIGFWLSKQIGKLVFKILTKREVDEGLTTFLSSFTVVAIKVIVIVTAISKLGIEMTSFVTILGAAGIAIGMAFSGTLSNFAGGIMILIIKPFNIDDTITAQGITGEVTEIQIFNTFILTPDNKTVILPNGPLINGTIVNFTRLDKRRLDVVLPLKYESSNATVSQNIFSLLESNTLILKDPAPQVYISEFDADHAKLTVSCWTTTPNFNQAQKDLHNTLYQWQQQKAAERS